MKYGKINIETIDEAINFVLYCLNNYQSGWNITYVEDVMIDFKLNKTDFEFKRVSECGVYEASYKF